MNKNPLTTVIVAIVAVLIVVGGVVALSSNSKPKTETTTSMNMDHSTSTKPKSSTTTEPTATSSVAIKDFAFEPASITVKVGTLVTWTNQDSVAHTVTSDEGVKGPSSELIEKGKTYSFMYTKAGTYTYFCTPHPYMKGTVTVTE